MFRDRLHAAGQLADQLAAIIGPNPLVLGIPRGGIPMAAAIAERLEGELDVVLVHKIGAPGNPEYAIGAVSEDGSVDVPPEERQRAGDTHIDNEAAAQLATLRERRQRYTPVRQPSDPRDRNVVIVDDGSATGATMHAALEAVRRRQPRQLIAALGVAPPDTVDELRSLADDVVCAATPRTFMAVGQFFQDFQQVDDDEVIRCLRASQQEE